MGTNYYLQQQPPCACCGKAGEPLHIGKSSGGWCFSLHVIPEQGIHDLEDWRRLWGKEGATILDEYDQTITKDEMDSIITDRSWPNDKNNFDYQRNHAIPGPNNLARHELGGRCIRNGKGTWDCIVGEFS